MGLLCHAADPVVRPNDGARPTRIGQARPSQLLTASGVGAVVDLPGMSVVVRGLDAWGSVGGPVITEPRLLDQVRGVLGENVGQLRAAPADARAADDAFTRVGVPVTTFPRWLRCPACHELWALDGVDQLELIHRWGRRPDLAKWVHTHCPKQGNTAAGRRRACIPARFVVACDRGHLDEFPYSAYLHAGQGETCPGPRIMMNDAGSTLGPRVTLSCQACDSRRNISEAAGTRGAAHLPRCRGRHPHLQTFSACDRPLKLMVLGASNMWFGVTASALHLPEVDGLSGLVRTHWDVLSVLPTVEAIAAVVSVSRPLDALADFPAQHVLDAVAAERARRTSPEGAGTPDDVPSLLTAEWELFSHPTTTDEDDDFRAAPTAKPDGLGGLLEQVVLVSRLREVQALLGFTRIDAPGRGELEPAHRVPLSMAPPAWIPAVERRGEGIFLQLREDNVATWAASVAEHPHAQALRAAYARWLDRRGRTPDPDFPVPRYLLLHTLSHTLLREVALECGYSSASIRERLYVGTPDAPTAGILLSTAASDSEGTLGGLVALANRAFLGPLLTRALESAQACSSDPLCAERLPDASSDALHAAACHACLFASETSCENGNRWLHRGVVADVADGLAFLL